MHKDEQVRSLIQPRCQGVSTNILLRQGRNVYHDLSGVMSRVLDGLFQVKLSTVNLQNALYTGSIRKLESNTNFINKQYYHMLEIA
jgi:hypothetical protein